MRILLALPAALFLVSCGGSNRPRPLSPWENAAGHPRNWQKCDRMFYHAMRCSGVSATEAKTMFYALSRFGRHWKKPRPTESEGEFANVPRALPVDETDLENARSWIENARPSLAQIEQRAETSRPPER